jgi:hypothetical protein
VKGVFKVEDDSGFPLKVALRGGPSEMAVLRLSGLGVLPDLLLSAPGKRVRIDR